VDIHKNRLFISTWNRGSAPKEYLLGFIILLEALGLWYGGRKVLAYTKDDSHKNPTQ